MKVFLFCVCVMMVGVGEARERMRVKYRMGKDGKRVRVGQEDLEVIEQGVEEPMELMNQDLIRLPTNKVERVAAAIQQAQPYQVLLPQTFSQQQRIDIAEDIMEDEALNEVMTSVDGGVEKTGPWKMINAIVKGATMVNEGMKSVSNGEYDMLSENMLTDVNDMVGEIRRKARGYDGSIGDLAFDVVKEVVAEIVSGFLTSSLGLSTGRNDGGGKSMMEIFLTVLSKVGQPQAKCK